MIPLVRDTYVVQLTGGLLPFISVVRGSDALDWAGNAYGSGVLGLLPCHYALQKNRGGILGLGRGFGLAM